MFRPVARLFVASKQMATLQWTGPQEDQLEEEFEHMSNSYNK